MDRLVLILLLTRLPCGVYTTSASLTYTVYTDKRTHTDASNSCQSLGGKLALPKTAAQYQNMKRALNMTRGAERFAWIGITRVTPNGSEWSFGDGTILGSWNNWANRQPNNLLGNQDCVEMRILIENQPISYRNFDGWNDEKCSTERKYVCEFVQIGQTILYGPNATFFSLNYNTHYRNNERCGQTFEVGEGQLVELHFEDFHIEYKEDCSSDNLTIYDGPNNQSPRLGIFCEGNVPGPVRSRGRYLYLYFQTDDSFTLEHGYNGTWRAVSNGQNSVWHMALRTEVFSQGDFFPMEIYSPDYPHSESYCNPLIYGQTLVAGEGLVLEASFYMIQVQDQNNCRSNNVTINDGPDRNSDLLRTYCSDRFITKSVLATGRQLSLYMQTNDSTISFKGRIRSIMDVCGAIHGGPNGTFKSFGYRQLDGYPTNQRCGQTFQVGEGQVVELTFEFFEVDKDWWSNCPDSVTIYDGPDTHSTVLGTYCGHTAPGPVTSSGRQLYLYFQSDGADGGRGFSGTYRANAKCGTTLGQGESFIACENDTSIQNHPWQVLIKLNKNGRDEWCGGVIVARSWIITAAHCADCSTDPMAIKVYGGSSQRVANRSQIFPAKRWVPHPHFNRTSKNNDIALIEIDGEFDASSATTRPVCLPGADDSTTFDDQSCVVTGWGKSIEDGSMGNALKKATVTVYNRSYCKDVSTFPDAYPELKDSHMCGGHQPAGGVEACRGDGGDQPAGGIEACRGDGGGPLVCARQDGTKMLAGIFSFGRCDMPEETAYYTRVSHYRQWIDRTMANKNNDDNGINNNSPTIDPTNFRPLIVNLTGL